MWVTDYMISRHAELIPVYESLGKTEYAERERAKLCRLREIQKAQTNKPIQLSLFE